jgi:hypothetical protein
VLPPPFGPDPAKPEAARFFFPSGIAIDPSSRWLVVSNSNADRQYDAGAMYSFRTADFEKFFLPTGAVGNMAFPTASLVGTAMTGNYTGPMVIAGSTPVQLDPTAYAGSRDTNRLNAIAIDPTTGALSCRTGATVATGQTDCRAGAIDLSRDATLEGPFGIVMANNVRLQDGTGSADALLISSLVPHIDDIQSGVLFTSSRLVAVQQFDPTKVIFSAVITDRISGGGIGAGPMVFDDRRREAILGGCYVRFGSASAGGEPSTLKCGILGNTSVLRFVPVDAGSLASTRIYDLGSQLHATDVTGLALGDVDPVTGMRRLYVVMRAPDAIARIGLPVDPAFPPIVEAVATISSTPSQIVQLKRPTGMTGNDLLAVTGTALYETSTTAGKLIILDGFSERVVGQVEGLGDTPFQIAQFPPQPGDTSARLAVSIFGGCRVSLVDVPYDRPGDATLRANLGSCPP